MSDYFQIYKNIVLETFVSVFHLPIYEEGTAVLSISICIYIIYPSMYIHLHIYIKLI